MLKLGGEENDLTYISTLLVKNFLWIYFFHKLNFQITSEIHYKCKLTQFWNSEVDTYTFHMIQLYLKLYFLLLSMTYVLPSSKRWRLLTPFEILMITKHWCMDFILMNFKWEIVAGNVCSNTFKRVQDQFLRKETLDKLQFSVYRKSL